MILNVDALEHAYLTFPAEKRDKNMIATAIRAYIDAAEHTQWRGAMERARDFIEDSSFNVPSKDYFDAVIADIDAALKGTVKPKSPDDCISCLRQLVEAYDCHAVEMNSTEIGGDHETPPHPWHEEWLYHTRAALSEFDGRP